ncbi:MAG TPA: non-ribosomal peptide synthetase, partial [Gemmatimonadales bacterium]|nr:non-ribosomal peptide synthetase [Gemmatimonadales bacterium]
MVAPLNPEYRAEELAREFESLAPSVVVVPAGGGAVAREVARSRGIAVAELVSEGESTGSFRLVLPGKVGRSKDVGLRGVEDVALLLHTSGTTSRPKQVPLTHRNLVSSMGHLIGSLGLTAEDRCLNLLPLFHIGGIVDVLAAPLAAGGRVFCESPFSVPAYRRGREAFAPTWTQLAPAMLRELVDAGERGPGSLRFVRSVSAALPVELLERAEGALGVPVVEIYGMTETAGVIASNPLPPGKRKAGSVGVSAGPEVSVVDGEGHPLPAGSRGEVVVRGPSVMSGYAGGGEANAGSWHGAWLRTGDEGYLDGEGYLFLTGRMKEMINRGGEKVSPHEVDEVLRAHPAVAEAAAFALKHPVLGEEVGAAVVLKAGMPVEARELVEYARARLAYFKVPRVVKVVASLPRTAGGKLKRHELALQVGAGQEEGGVERAAYVEPATALQRELARYWAVALGVERVGADDDFFALGGDSLKGAALLNRLDGGDELFVTSLFDARTVASFAAWLESRHPALAARLAAQRGETPTSAPP